MLSPADGDQTAQGVRSQILKQLSSCQQSGPADMQRSSGPGEPLPSSSPPPRKPEYLVPLPSPKAPLGISFPGNFFKSLFPFFTVARLAVDVVGKWEGGLWGEAALH